jgi:hypothetical protein
MTDDTDMPPDEIAAAVLSGSAYERLRIERHSHFKQSIPRKLTWQTGLLVMLATVFPLYLAFPESAAVYLPGTDPTTANPQVLLLGVFGGGVELFAATLMVGVGLFRLRKAPVTERQAETMVNLETMASYLGFGTGGLAIFVTVGYFAMGLAGTGTLEAYTAFTDGVNPFAPAQVGLSVETVAVGATVAALCLLTVSQYLDVRFDHLRRTQVGPEVVA